jgi:biopolymer transport protein ExbD
MPALLSPAREPLGEMNTTPLIDVLLVLLVMLVMTIPAATHSLEIQLPKRDTRPAVTAHPVRNALTITRDERLVWNGQNVSEAQLAAVLREVATMRPEPEVQFRPDANASYDTSARVLRIVKATGVTRFGFVGNEQYRAFAR